MSFSQMLEMLQEENKGKIVMCNAGNFYIAVGKDAIFLNRELGLKVSCFKEEVCKVGFPLQALEKYTNILKEKDYSFIIYNFNKEKIELKKILINEGKKKNGEIDKRLNCYICKHSCKYYKKEDIYLRAMVELQRKEMEMQKKEEKEIKKDKKEKKKNMVHKQEQENKLKLIPKAEKYIEYMLQVILKLPRTEKFSIGTEYKLSMYQMLKNIMMIAKTDRKNVLEYLNEIDGLLNAQRIYLRIMKKEKWIAEKKFKVAMEQIYEIGKILGGLIKYYAKDSKK